MIKLINWRDSLLALVLLLSVFNTYNLSTRHGRPDRSAHNSSRMMNGRGGMDREALANMRNGMAERWKGQKKGSKKQKPTKEKESN